MTRSGVAFQGPPNRCPFFIHCPQVSLPDCYFHARSSARESRGPRYCSHGEHTRLASPLESSRPQGSACRIRLLGARRDTWRSGRSEEHTSELQSHHDLVCRLLLEKKKACRAVCRSP